MRETLSIDSVRMWLEEAKLYPQFSPRYEEWVEYTTFHLMEWLGDVQKYNICGFSVAELKKILHIDGDRKFNDWASLYCSTLERWIQEVK